MEKLGPADPQQIGAYRLLARLGAGGMGQVYLARSGRGRTVAVKLVRQELAEQEEFRARFRQEVAAARRVGGRWTAPVLDADTEAAIPWVATGYVAGPSLHSVVSPAAGRARGSEASGGHGAAHSSGGHGPLPERSVHILGAGLAHALRDIHAAGLIHRDLKPSNILVTIDGPRVIDFGIARALETVADPGLTRTGALIGSPGFMAPEQVRGERLTPACDIFCLGAVLAYAATGRLPFGTADSGVHALMYRIATEPPTLDGVPESLQDLVRDCLHKNPAARPSPDQIVARTRGGDGEPWLPGALVAQLGSHAIRLLEVENPDATGTANANATPQSGATPRGDARTGGVPGGARAGSAWPGGDTAGGAGAPAGGGAAGAVGGAAAAPGHPGAEAFPPEGPGPGTAAPGAGESLAPGGAGAGTPGSGSAAAPGGTGAAPGGGGSAAAATEGARAGGSADGGHGAGVGGHGGGPAAAPGHPGAGAPRSTGPGADGPRTGSAEAAPPGDRTSPPPAAGGGAAATPRQAGAGAPRNAGSRADTPGADTTTPGAPGATRGAATTPRQPHAGAPGPGGVGPGVGTPTAGSPAGGMPPGARAGGMHAMPTVVSAAGPPPALARPQPRPPAPPGQYGYPAPHYVYQPPSPEPPPRTTRSTVALIAVALVVALAAGGSVYAFMNSGGSEGDGRTDNRNGSPTPSSGGDESATPSTGSSPTPEEGDDAVPEAYLGTWSGGLDSSEGYSTRRLTLQQGRVGDTVLSLTADGPMKGGGTYHCVFQAKLAAAPSGDAPLRIGPSKVVVGEPMTSCTPGAASEVTLLPDGRLRRVNSTSGEALTYSKSE
ncbi:serine/threonine-protein kinase [Streptomyces spiramyceticus]|uniref:serine/threonine-protein kinase n=1 Tax=Streptomyces spiramyceticus TaxID=299717 RepID=UPI00237A7318|nr:serine/threonine-protein kinase [Streptomyces spiramyceticus]